MKVCPPPPGVSTSARRGEYPPSIWPRRGGPWELRVLIWRVCLRCGRRCVGPEPHATLPTMHLFSSQTNKHDACNHASPITPNPTRTGCGQNLNRRCHLVLGVRHVRGRELTFYACWLRPRPCVITSAPWVIYHTGDSPTYVSEIGGACCISGCGHCHSPVLPYPSSLASPILSH